METITYSPFTSIFENGTNTTLIVGSPGAGKTYMLNTIILNALIMKQKVFAIDPKNDLGKMTKYFPELELVDVNNIKPGALNPFDVLDKVDVLTLSSILDIIVGGLTDQQKNLVTPILQDFINEFNRKHTRVTLLQIAERFYENDHEELQQLGAKLSACANTKYGKLLFADNVASYDKEGNPTYIKAFHLSQRSKIISLFGMDLPNSNNSDITEEQQFNSAIVYIICCMVKQLMLGDRYPTLFVMDEAHIAYASEQFRSLVDSLMILGRSLNIAVVLASQSVSHYDNTVEQYLCARFMFKSATKDAREFLERFSGGIAGSIIDVDDVIQNVADFEVGECFYIDRKNRSGIFHVVSPLKEITTNPLYSGGNV